MQVEYKKGFGEIDGISRKLNLRSEVLILKMLFNCFFLVVIFTPSIFAQAGEKCVTNRNSASLNFSPHPKNCSMFLSCSFGIYREMECPARLHFNAVKKICDWPASAGCKPVSNVDETPLIDEPEEEAILGQRCQPSDIRNSPRVAAYTKSCDRFLVCAGVWTLMNCPPGLLFSVESGQCEFPENAKCCPTCLTAPQKCSKNGIRLSNPSDCHKFYICQNQTLVESTCADNTVFSATKGECVNGTSCFSLMLPPTENLPSCSIEGALYPNYQNCKKFYICNGGTIVEQSCPPNKFVSVEHNNCQYKLKAVCANNLKKIKKQ
jgi:hypothetical protein